MHKLFIVNSTLTVIIEGDSDHVLTVICNIRTVNIQKWNPPFEVQFLQLQPGIILHF
jgi:hypothetical protein